MIRKLVMALAAVCTLVSFSVRAERRERDPGDKKESKADKKEDKQERKERRRARHEAKVKNMQQNEGPTHPGQP